MRLLRASLCVAVLIGAPGIDRACAADAAFQAWLQSMWPQAQKLGVSRATFDAATHGLEPDLSLPDLVLPGRAEKPPPGQAEFVQTPASYLKEATFARSPAQGASCSISIARRSPRSRSSSACRGNIVLAIWGRETDYGRYKLPHNAVRVLATQAYIGKRKEKFREEFLLALKMLQEGHVRLADMRSSWAGAMGLTQFLPSEFYKYAVDFDGDGRRDIWNSVPDALASAAKQLVGKGWQRGPALGLRGARAGECRLHASACRSTRCRSANGSSAASRRPMAASSRAAELAEPASLLQPEGSYGPAFLTLKNYYVIKEYNFSDLYVLFVGHLSDRISDPRPFETPWSKGAQLRTARGRGDAAHADQARHLQGQDRRQGRHADARGARRISEGERPQGRLLADRGGARPHAGAGRALNAAGSTAGNIVISGVYR